LTFSRLFQDKKKKTTRPKKVRDRKVIDEEDEDEDDDDDWIKVDHGALDKPKMFDKDAEINHQLVVKKLVEIMAARGESLSSLKCSLFFHLFCLHIASRGDSDFS
jgi:translation initiation factor 3 subunit C